MKTWTLPLRVALYALAVLALTAGLAQAQISPTLSSVTINQPTTLMVSPNGGGMTLASRGSVLNLTVLDVNGLPVAITWNDLEIDGWNPPNVSDGFSAPVTHDITSAGFTVGAAGQYSFSGTLLAGGQDQGALVKVMGVPINGAPLALTIVSPDIDGNGIVNLSDVGLFAGDLFGGYNYRSDFNGDGLINISDVGFMAQQLGAAFPGGYVIDPVD